MQIAPNMFAQVDGNGDGAITQSELEQAVTAAGGAKAGADALFAKLDPNGTGSVSEQQFAPNLLGASPPPIRARPVRRLPRPRRPRPRSSRTNARQPR